MTESNLVAKSSMWVLAVAWFNRVLGFVSVFILARLLTPADFGIMASLLVVIQIASVATDIGTEQYYIQKSSVSSEDLNICWSLNLSIKCALTVLLIFLASPITSALDISTLLTPLIFLSFLPLINGLANGYIMHLKRTLEFHRFATFSAAGQVIGGITSIAVALIFHNYWALILGMIINAVVQTLLSYMLITHRAKFEIANLNEPLKFGKWLLLKNTISHVRAKFDIWFATVFFNSSGIGAYSTMKDIAMLPARELVGPLFQVFYAFMSEEKQKKNQNERVYTTFFILFSLCMPLAIGLHLIASELVLILLGQQWVAYTDLLANLAVLTLSFAIGNFVSDALISRGKIKSVFIYDVLTLSLALLFIYMAFDKLSQPSTLALYRGGIGFFMLLSGISWLIYTLKLNILRMVRISFAVSISSVGMFVLMAPILASIESAISAILLAITLGPVIYLLILSLTSYLSVLSSKEKELLKKVAMTMCALVIKFSTRMKR